jgi:glycosyltransferase involved in cell wall biosynthesis
MRRAFAHFCAERPARLILLGEGKLRPHLQSLAQQLGISASVEMPGEVNNVMEWMQRADLVVSSSLWEGVQATLIEALAVGCPVVATDCPGGARETLEGGRLGSLVPVQDPRKMADAMAWEINSPPDPLLLATSALRFTGEGKAEQYLALFDRYKRDDL